MGEEDKLSVKIVIIGEASVGKTSLMSNFVSNTFSDQMQPTIGCDIQNKSMIIEGRKADVRLWDTAGCERFQTMLPLYYRGCHGAILVYDVTRRETFEKLRDWLVELKNNLTNDNAVVMIIGNKIDKVSQLDSFVIQSISISKTSNFSCILPSTLKTGRQVSKEEGINYAKQRSALFIETSAKTSEGVAIAFEELLMKVIQTPGLLDQGHGGVNLRDRGEKTSSCNWATNMLSSVWSSITG